MVKEKTKYSTVVEVPQRRTGITNKPKAVQGNPTENPSGKNRGCSGQGPKPRRGIHCLGLTLKTHQAIKQDQGDAWQNTAAESVTRQQLESFRQPAIVKIL